MEKNKILRLVKKMKPCKNSEIIKLMYFLPQILSQEE